MPKDIFISHSHSDRDIATALTDCIVSGAGLRYRDILCTSHSHPDAQLKPGEDINRTLRKHLKECRVLVPIISSDSLERNYVLFEIGGAWALECKIMPVVVQREMKEKMPEIIRGLFYTEYDVPERVKALIIAIERECFSSVGRPDDEKLDATINEYFAKLKLP